MEEEGGGERGGGGGGGGERGGGERGGGGQTPASWKTETGDVATRQRPVMCSGLGI